MNVYELTYEERAEILENAARAIQVRGWCRRTTIDTEGHVCAVGGIAFGAGWTEAQVGRGAGDNFTDIYDLENVYRHVGEKPVAGPGGTLIRSIVDYNDRWEASSSEVVEALLARAKQLRTL